MKKLAIILVAIVLVFPIKTTGSEAYVQIEKNSCDFIPICPLMGTSTELTYIRIEDSIEEDKVDTEETAVSEVACSCVKTARMHVENLPMGNATELEVNTMIPSVGAVVKMQYPSVGHVAVIQKITTKGMWIIEGNYHKCQISQRFIPFDYPYIVGYWVG